MNRLAALLMATVLPAPAQFLHNERLDKKSQEALTAAKAVANGEVFTKELQNLDRLWKLTSSRVFQTAELQMAADLSGFFDWPQVARVVDRAKRDIGTTQQLSAAELAQWTELKKQLAADKEAAKIALAELKAAAKNSAKDFTEISEWLGRLGKFQELEKKASDISGLDPGPRHVALVAELSATFKSLSELYRNFEASLPASPPMVVLQSQLELAKVGEQHLVQLGLIRARLELDLTELQQLVTAGETSRKCVLDGDGRDCVKVSTNDVSASLEIAVKELKDARQKFRTTQAPADDALQLVAKKHLDNQLSFLVVAAALSARGNTAHRLALLREADENQRCGIRESSLAARSYEQLLVNGAQRLALYHQGGIRPEMLARLLNAVGTLGLIPTVLSK